MKNDSSKPICSKTTEMVIGKCKYIITTHFNENGRETAEQKMLRYVSDRIADEVKNGVQPAGPLSL